MVETRPGAGTVIGTAAAAKADPDGYTLLMTVSNHATNPALVHERCRTTRFADFEPISMLGARAGDDLRQSEVRADQTSRS